jgi:hypothetical protein
MAGKALKSPVATRWLTHYTMLEAFVDNLDVLNTAVMEHGTIK